MFPYEINIILAECNIDFLWKHITSVICRFHAQTALDKNDFFKSNKNPIVTKKYKFTLIRHFKII